MRAGGARFRRRARLRPLLIGVAAAFVLAACESHEDLESVPLGSLAGTAEANGRISLTEEGLVIGVDRQAHLVLPFAAEVLELDIEADAPVLLSWTTVGDELRPYAAPWRYLTVPRERRTVRLDLRQAAIWYPFGRAALVFDGAGTVVVRALRLQPVPTDFAQAMGRLDWARVRAPEGVGPKTINSLTEAKFGAMKEYWIADAIAAAALVVMLVALLVVKRRTRKWRPGVALAIASLAATVSWNAFFLVRFMPLVNWHLTADEESRIRANYYFAPDLGALAALARRVLRDDDRVGVMSEPGDWFGAQTLCFNLAPRRCVVVQSGAAVNLGISGIDRLRLDEMDAIVAYRIEKVPDGYAAVAAVSRSAFVARRK